MCTLAYILSVALVIQGAAGFKQQSFEMRRAQALQAEFLQAGAGDWMESSSSLADVLMNGFWNVGPVMNATAAAAPVGETVLAINSEGQHEGSRQTVDIILLFICLAVPFVIFGVIKRIEIMQEREQKRQELEAAEAEKNSDGKISRIGSSYHLEGNDKNISITAALGGGKGKEGPDEGTFLQNVFAGFSTAMAALPDAISFSFITGVSPLNGIWAGCFMGLSAALVGGRPGMISSASAATAVVLARISTDPNLGMGPMALCVFIVGILQIICGMLRLSRFITLVPHSVMLGFVNGLAIVMIRAQMRQFHEHGDGPWVEKDVAVSMVITALVAIAAAVVWKRLPVVSKILPAPLASLIITVVFSIIFEHLLPRRTLREVAGSRTFRGGTTSMPSWDFPPAGVNYHDGAMWGTVISIAVRFAIVGLLESLMTQALIDQITGTTGSMRRECFGQGVGNIISSFFGTQGGCALIAQSLLNVSSGGHSRVSGVTMGITLFLSVVALAPLMAQIPVAALVGLIVLIALNTFAWSSLALILRINWVDAIVVVVVTAVTVWKDLCVAVVIGVIICGLGFAWTTASHVELMTRTESDKRIISMKGPLFFGSAMNYQKVVTKAKIEEGTLILDFTHAKILDISAIDAVEKSREYWLAENKKVLLRGLPKEALRHLPKDCELDDDDDQPTKPADDLTQKMKLADF
jgi:SulP family sulfate permease